MSESLLNAKQLASRLSVPVSWVYQRSATDGIPCVRVGRYVRFDYDTVRRHLAAEHEAANVARAR